MKIELGLNLRNYINSHNVATIHINVHMVMRMRVEMMVVSIVRPLVSLGGIGKATPFTRHPGKMFINDVKLSLVHARFCHNARINCCYLKRVLHLYIKSLVAVCLSVSLSTLFKI